VRRTIFFSLSAQPLIWYAKECIPKGSKNGERERGMEIQNRKEDEAKHEGKKKKKKDK
jgi:hypothetical protein